MPTLYNIAGPNGVGKTTFADRYLPDEAKQLEFVNADLIARGLSPYDPDSVSIEAGKIALKRIKELIAHKISFSWETTMSGRTAVGWLREARNAGYTLKAAEIEL
jgi:predicted ABC-type ATPase